MKIHPIIQSQYLATLKMLEGVIEACPDSLWDAENDKNRFWLVAYHALFYAHLYLQPTEQDFVRWEKDRGQRSLGEMDQSAPPYSKAELLEYVDFCRAQVRTIVPGLDLEAESGFYWLPFSKLELHFYSIRHVMQHTGELMERLWVRAGTEISWVGMQPVE